MKKLILLILLLPSLCFAGSIQDAHKKVIARMNATASTPISFDASSSDAGEDWSDTVSWSHTLSAAADSLIVLVGATEVDVTWSSCTWDSGGGNESMTGLTERGNTNDSLRFFYLDNPTASGTKTISCTASGGGTMYGVAISLIGSVYDGSNEDGSFVEEATSITDALTTGSANAWVVTGTFVRDANDADLATTQGETKRVEQRDDNGGGNVIAIATELIVSAGANNFGWGSTSTTARTIQMMEFEIK